MNTYGRAKIMLNHMAEQFSNKAKIPVIPNTFKKKLDTCFRNDLEPSNAPKKAVSSSKTC